MKKDNNNNINPIQNYLENFVSFGEFNKKWEEFFNFAFEYAQYYWGSDILIKYIKYIYSNKTMCIVIFLFLSWLWSNFFLNMIYYFMLIDSVILSLLVLQNNSVTLNSRRLCKNIILLALTSINIIGGIFTLLMVMFVYMEYSKFINRVMFKLLKFAIKMVGNIFPPVYLLYPNIRLFNFDDPDITIENEYNSVLSSGLKNKLKKSNKNKIKNKTNKVKDTGKFKKLYFSTNTSISNENSHNNSSENYDYSSDSNNSDNSDNSDSSNDSSSSNNSSSSDSSNSPTISSINNDIIKKKLIELTKALNKKK